MFAQNEVFGLFDQNKVVGLFVKFWIFSVRCSVDPDMNEKIEKLEKSWLGLKRRLQVHLKVAADHLIEIGYLQAYVFTK